MSEVKEAIIIEDESEGDDIEELHTLFVSVRFHQNQGKLSYCQVTFPSTEI